MALFPPAQRSFFGIDPGQWLRQWRAAGARLLMLPALRWLQPSVRVQLLQADGRRSDWQVAHGVAAAARAGHAAEPTLRAMGAFRA